jgi:flagellar biosynthesis protein FlhF
MQVKRYEVSSMSEALKKIKEDLGPDAIILSTKKIKGLNSSAFEVMAARDEKVVLPEKNISNSLPSKSTRLTENYDDIFKYFHVEIGKLKEIIISTKKENSLSLELEELKETMDKFFDVLGARKGKANQNINSTIYYKLLANGFSRASACRILETVSQEISTQAQSDDKLALNIVENFIMNSVPAASENKEEKRIKAFVGAPGVGKTTTMAKLAARYSIMKKMKVGMITTDTFRVAATEQLRTYAKIMGIRMEVASTKETFQKALQLFSDKDCVLIDTPGRSHVDDGYSNILDIFLQNKNIETSLLVSATASADNLQDTVTRYSSFNYDNLILTKIDESRRFGIFYDVINKARKPISFLTCGQNIPQDIEEVTPRRIANLIMRSSVN